jgi:hypothetical protein
MKKILYAFLIILVALLQTACETSRTEKDLVTGSERKTGGWFQFGEYQKYEPQPHERRVDDLLAHPRK